MKIKNLKFLFLLIACVAIGIMLSVCNTSGKKTDSDTAATETAKYMATDTIPILNFDSIRGNVKTITQYYYNLKDDNAVMFEPNKDEDAYECADKFYYNELAILVRSEGCFNWGGSDRIYKYDTQGRLIKTIQAGAPGEHESCEKEEYVYDTEGRLKEIIKYHVFAFVDGYFSDNCNTAQKLKLVKNRDKKIHADVSVNWSIMGKTEYVYNEYGEIEEEIRYSYNADTKQFEDPCVYEVTNIHYNAAGELLLKGHQFQCTFDKYGNWLTKIDGKNLFIERKIEYYE